MLSSGPGPGPLLAAAAAWNSLSVTYTEVAAELSAVVAAVQTADWEGPAAESFAAANAPYVTWLLQAAANAATTAAEYETEASAYTVALAAMPTLGELAANHIAHAALVATNFFGINTIPIALNEADYVRMWIQAATIMNGYEAVSTAAVTALPSTAPAPALLRSDAPTAAADFNPLNILTDWEKFVEYIVDELFGVDSPPYILPLLEALLQNPSPELLATLLFVALPYEVIFNTVFFAPAALLATPFLPLVGLAGLGGLAGLAALPRPGAEPIVGITEPEPQFARTAPNLVVAPVAPAPAPAAPATAAGSTPTSTPASTPASAPSVGTASFGYLVFGGPPAGGEGPTLIDRGKGHAVPAEVSAAAAASSQASAQQRARRRRRTVMRDNADEFMDLNSGPETPSDEEPQVTAASDRGAGPLGFSGTTSSGNEVRPEGLITLSDDFGARPAMPMLPQTWGTEHDAGSADFDGHQGTRHPHDGYR